MIKVKKNRINAEECLSFCMDKRYTGHYKYFYEVMLHRDDVEKYKEYLLKCEESEMEFCFVYIDTNEQYKLLGGFTNFELKGMNKSGVDDFFFPGINCDDIIIGYFSNWQERCKYYILSSNMENYKNKKTGGNIINMFNSES